MLASGLPSIKGITNVVDTFPLPNNFTAPLVRVSVGGSVYYLNDTDQYAKLGSRPAHDGKLCLALNNQNVEIIRPMP